MNDAFLKRLFEVYTHPRAELYTKAYHLIEHYNSNRLDEEIAELIHMPQFDEMETLPSLITTMFTTAMYDILVNMLVVPKQRDFDELLYLLNGVWLIENSYDSPAIMDIIDAMDYPVDPADALASLLEYVDRQDWIVIRGYLHTVTQTFIRKVYNLHREKVEAEVDEGAENTMERKTDALRTYFGEHPESMVYRLIRQGQLGIPSDVSKLLPVMTSFLYQMEEDDQVAVELVAMALILPITLKSTSKQAKIFADKLYPDPTKIIALNTRIEALVKPLGNHS